MNEIKIVKPDTEYELAFVNMIKEWNEKGEVLIPGAANLKDKNFSEFLTISNLLKVETPVQKICTFSAIFTYWWWRNNLEL